MSGSATTFLISICEWHIVDPKWCKISGKHKGLFERSFSKEDLDKAAYILGIKIYRDRSRRLMILSKNAHLDMILKESKIDQQRRSSWLCYKVWVLSKTQDLTTAEERERTKVVPYALDVGSTVCYAKYRTWCVPCHMSGKRVQRWSRSGSPDSGKKIVHGVIRTCFSIMEVIKSSA